jgi:hypothetical protein
MVVSLYVERTGGKLPTYSKSLTTSYKATPTKGHTSIITPDIRCTEKVKCY